MKTLVLLACVTLAYCGKTKKQILDQQHIIDGYEFEYAAPDASALSLIESNPHYVDVAPAVAVAASSHHSSHSHLARPGYSVGGPLASIAKGAAEQAHTQLNQQPSAAGQAAYVAKNTLAQAAAQSAATAAAALAGKQVIVMGLEQQSRDAHVAVDGEKQQLQQAQRAAAAAKNAAQQAMHQVQLAAARLDFETTQAAAQKAANAAQAAQGNAAAAAAHAAKTAAATSAGHHPSSLHAGHVIEIEPTLSLANALPVDGYEYKGYY
ncbi:hypothetical protein EAI_07746 [Harpegnathos saltator]|uniref:Uncharacterized protein n=1 Tax=Harpegnathos saltator TaxID=610380 RepID=E2B531_HARSA|nr:hypothetical protein EAI_07746 [Harpegnathos saltator]